MYVRLSDNKKVEMVKVLTKTTALFKDSKGNEVVLSLDEVEVAKDLRKCDVRSL